MQMALQQHPNDNARDAKPMVWIFEGSNVYLFVGGFAASLVAFRFCFDRGLSMVESTIVATIPISTAIGYVVFLKAGKPASYDGDMLVSLNYRLICWLQRMGLIRFGGHLHMKPSKPPAHPRAELSE
jgi:hypothetical protein